MAGLCQLLPRLHRLAAGGGGGGDVAVGPEPSSVHGAAYAPSTAAEVAARALSEPGCSPVRLAAAALAALYGRWAQGLPYGCTAGARGALCRGKEQAAARYRSVMSAEGPQGTGCNHILPRF